VADEPPAVMPAALSGALKQVVRSGCVIGGVSAGVYPLAQLGLLDGYRAAMEAAREPVEVLVGDWTADSGYALGAALDPATTAVFAANDQMALGLIHALADRGIDVPGDVSVVGFDDLADVAHYRPPLTTVRQDFSALGQRAIETLVAVMAGEARPRIATIPASLTVRDSTATPSR